MSYFFPSYRSKYFTSDLKDEMRLEEELGQKSIKEKEWQNGDIKVRKELGALEAHREGIMTGTE